MRGADFHKQAAPGLAAGGGRSYGAYGHRWPGLDAGSDTDNHAWIRQTMAPLIARLDLYDTLRLRLEREGGNIDDLKRITAVLHDQFSVEGLYGSHRASLTDRKELNHLISDVGFGSLFLDIRRQRHGLPVYYLCRVVRDYWAEYGLIVEDLYMSPGFALPDPRFTRLMCYGHESYYLRISQFRAAVRARMDPDEPQVDAAVDDLLHDVGRYCLASMWHDEQRPAMAAARHFGLNQFQQAVELLYLCLSADLCELRSHLSPFMCDFFARIYPQPAVHAFFEKLRAADGREVNNVPRSATYHFARLSRAFRTFLATEVNVVNGPPDPSQIALDLNTGMIPPAATALAKVPLYKLVFGNFYQLDLVADNLRQDDGLRHAVAALETEAREIAQEILNLQLETSCDPGFRSNHGTQN